MRIVVVGGGISGLAAAHRLVGRAPSAEVILIEQAGVLGGKLRTGTLAGRAVEMGAEAFLTADPAGRPSAAIQLAGALGLAGAIVHPATTRAAIAVEGQLIAIPPGTLMGITAEPDAVRDADGPRPLLARGEDVTVGGLVRPRRGDTEVDRFVDPLLGGVYAGRADELSLRMALPALATAAESAHTLTDAVRAALAARRTVPGAPVFATVHGGVSVLVRALAAVLSDVRLGQPVRDLRRAGEGWRLTVGSTRDARVVDADGVVLAVPAAPAARLLSIVDDVLAVPLDYASVALIGLALPIELPDLSGFLVPASEGIAVKAVTFVDHKWGHSRRPGEPAVVRASVGRAGEEQVLQRDDAALIDQVRRELSSLLGHPASVKPVDAVVSRWGGALPQYTPGHPDRVAALRAGLSRHPALAVAGAAYDGVGIPACIRSGQAAADAVLAGLKQWTA